MQSVRRIVKWQSFRVKAWALSLTLDFFSLKNSTPWASVVVVNKYHNILAVCIDLIAPSLFGQEICFAKLILNNK